MPAMDGLLIAALVGSVIFGSWFLIEVWVRLGEVQQVPFSEREERSGSEDTFWRVRAQVPTSHSVEEKWVWVSRKQYEGPEDQQAVLVHVRRLGDRTIVRGVNHWRRVWWLGLATFYFVFNSIGRAFDL